MKTGKRLQESFYSLTPLILNEQDKKMIAAIVAMASKVGCLKKTPDNQKTYTHETRDALLKALSLGILAYFEQGKELSRAKAVHELTKHEQSHEQFCTLFDIDKHAISLEDKEKALDILKLLQSELNQEKAHPVFKCAISNHSLHDNTNVRSKLLNAEQYGFLITHFNQFIQILRVNYINACREAHHDTEQNPTNLMQPIVMRSNSLLFSQFFDNALNPDSNPDTNPDNQLDDLDDADFEIIEIEAEASEEKILEALSLAHSAMFHRFKQAHDAQYSVLRSAVNSALSYFFSSNINTEMHNLLHPDPTNKDAPRITTWEQVQRYAYKEGNEATTSRTICDCLRADLKADYERHLKNKVECN